MSTAALAVGVAVTGGVALLIAAITILFCILHKNSPNGRTTSRSTNSQTPRRSVMKSTPRSTEKIKKKAEQLKERQSRSSCCGPILCACGGKIDGPLPHPPFGLDIKDQGESTVTIVWNAPSTENSTAPIHCYKIYVRFKEAHNAWAKVAKVKPMYSEYRLKGLTAGRRYVAGVSSKSKTGESQISETPTIILKKSPVKPGPPTEFEVIKKTHNSITVSWKPPKNTGYARIQNYHLKIKDFSNGANWTHLCTLQAFDRYMDYRVTQLKSNCPYRFKVNAENIVGQGPFAETVNIETLNKDPEPPEKPRGPIKYSKITHHSITLSWRPPEQDGGRPISGYAIEHRERGSTLWHKAGVCETHIDGFTASGLQEDIEYQFRVSALNDVGNGPPLVGAKVRTRLMEIPLSRRSSFRLSSREGNSRGSLNSDRQFQTKKLDDGLILDRLGKHPSVDSLQALDLDLESDPHVPKSDFFTYDETDTGNISTRHQENRTRHSSSSVLPLPPSQKEKRVNKRKRRHHDFSPLPVHTSSRMKKGYSYNSGHDPNGELEYRQASEYVGANDPDENKINNDDSGQGDAYNARFDDAVKHITPSNVAFSNSHKY